MDNMLPKDESVAFLWRRLSEETPTWAIGVPVLFAFLVVALIVIFRQEKKMLSALIGGGIVGVISLVYLPLAYLLVKHFSWMVILIPVMAVALFYVVLMYLRDAKSVHFLWAFFLGLMRTCVYIILAVVFLLPGCQYSEKQEYESETLILLDVSDSMNVVDDLPIEGQDPKTLPSRQDKILSFLTSNVDEKGRDKVPFIDQVVKKTPLRAYRFGAVLDESEIVYLHSNANKAKPFTVPQWKSWLKPDKKEIPAPNVENLKGDEVKEKLAQYAKRLDMIDTLKSGTNIGGAALQAHKIENNSHLQAMIFVSDGQSNFGSGEALAEFLSRVNNQKRTIPILTIGVGQFRLPASIRIDDINAPEETRPDDPFAIRVPVVGQGLNGEVFTVTVEVKRVKDVTGKPVEEAAFTLPPQKGMFKGKGDHPQDIVDFKVDVQELKQIKAQDDKNSDLEGEWHIIARVPRHPKEPFAEKFHVTEPIKVQVQKRALRVLLFAGGATREYQFLRSILYREMLEKRMEMCVLLQTGREDHIDQDVEPKRLLADFPNKLGPNDPGQEFMSLNDYDVIVAFDPDWSRLSTKQLKLLNEWVGTHSGGIIYVAGPVFSFQLARPAGRDINKLLEIYPVVLKDSRLHGLGLPGSGLGHDASRPYSLKFAPAAKQFDFIKLDEAGDTPISGWKGFFWNDEKFPDEAVKDQMPRRGFFTYYPVERVKPASAVIAAFAGPKEGRIGEKSEAFKDQQPFIVTMPFGNGKTLYIGDGSLWRLRAFKDGFHERLWIKMARYVSAGATQQKKYGRWLMAGNAPVGLINVEAQVKGKDLLPLSSDLRPTVRVRRIDKNRPDDAPDKKEGKGEIKKNNLQFDLQPKPTDGEHQGYFVGNITIVEPGEYEFQLPIPGTTESLRRNLIVRKPNPELDNVRTNFGYLYQMASDSRDLLNKLSPETRKRIEGLLKPPEDMAGVDGKSKRLFFPLSSADAVADCLVPVPPKSDTVKGRLVDLWDGGLKTDRVVHTYWAAVLMPLAIGAIGVILLLLLRQWVSALVFFGICAAMSLGVVGIERVFSTLFEGMLDLNFSYLLLMIVSLLGIEWLARKLLRLA